MSQLLVAILTGIITCCICITVITSAQVYHFEQNSVKLHQSDSTVKQPHDVCGYEACDLGKPDMLNVHLVPHTHDDVGWLKTVDQYYYGAQNKIQHAAVQYILDTVIDELLKDPARRFIYVEIAFFYRWWNEQEDYLRHQVIKLVNSGRLEFILGGWCMNDEAATHYNAIIDQHTVGFKFLKEVFGDCARPKIGWQIDPFGHSREQASLFAQFGFDGLFFGRLDYQDKDKRMKNKTAEMMWLASDNLGDQAALFTGVNYNGYGAPNGFCFDRGCTDDPIMDDDTLEDYNVDDRVKAFLKAAQEQAKNYTTNHIMMTMGSDFQYENAHENFKNLDKLIKYVNMAQSNDSKVNAFYSTPSCYLYAVNKANQTYTSKTDDFFPYASRAHTFWTGYFISRPALKGYVRRSNNFLQAVKQMETLAMLDPAQGSSTKMDIFRQAMGVAQHHDAVSGTEKQAVADDYVKRLARGNAAAAEVANMAYAKWLPLNSSVKAPLQVFCPLANVSVCNVSVERDDFTITIYNPLGRSVNYWIQLPIGHMYHNVYDSDMTKLNTTHLQLDKSTRMNPEFINSSSRANFTLIFKAKALPPLGFKTYFVQQQTDRNERANATLAQPTIRKVTLPSEHDNSGTVEQPYELSIETDHVKLTFDDHTGYLSQITNKDKNITTNVSQIFMYYKSFAGNNSADKFQASGAYAFRPNGSEPEMINLSHPDITIVKDWRGAELWADYGNWTFQKTKLLWDDAYVEIEWTIGPIPIDDMQGKEVINKIVTDLKTDNTFYTDSNGRELLKRVIDYRPTWDLNQTEHVAGNYYPINSRIALMDRDKNIQLTLLTDRSQGGGSITDGEMEVMVHRRILHDDSFGAGEPLNETAYGEGLVVRGRHILYLDTINDSAKFHRDMAERMFMAPIISLAELTMSPKDYAKQYRTMWSGMKKELPHNVHLLTLEEFSADTYILRLEHFYEKAEDSKLSMDATISLKGLFVPFEIDSVIETTLGANSPIDSTKRLSWNVKDMGRTNSDMSKYVKPLDKETLTVLLHPMQIRTFQVTLKPN